ncbi:hypothetical protein GGS26DRAFT_579157 [Hypomontagnella submonticulosa]|nr:hypothetical protein GGS26DRAFT_579157 [Hypomontagnella submonticulosa]
MMGEIYNSAKLVIVAAVDNAHSGLPGRGNHQRQLTKGTETIQGIDFTNGQPELRDQLETTIWNTRGWTYQEVQLARRALIITGSQVHWSCREESWCEDRFTEFQNLRHYPIGHDSLFAGAAPQYLHHCWPGISYPCSFRKYCHNVTEFSSRSFSDPKDTLWAFIGILGSLLSEFPEGYIWGMPTAKLDGALLWETDNSRALSDPLTVRTSKGEWREFTIPSWCWISKGSAVWYSLCYDLVESMVEWHEPIRVEENELLRLVSSQEGGEGEEGTGNPQSTIFLHDQISSENTIFDFALLHFTTHSTTLRIHPVVSREAKICSVCSIVPAKISLPSGKDIGFIRVPISTFSSNDETQGEFILLSSNMTGKYGKKLEEPEYNIMLVRWSDDTKLAYRVAWTAVKKSAWEECQTQTKTIILG